MRLKIKMIKSMIGRPEKHRRVLESLGLKRIGNEVLMRNNPVTRGMVKKVIHLVDVTEIDGD